MNNSEKVELILIFDECNRSSRQAARVYADRYPDRFHPHHNYVHRLLRGTLTITISIKSYAYNNLH